MDSAKGKSTEHVMCCGKSNVKKHERKMRASFLLWNAKWSSLLSSHYESTAWVSVNMYSIKYTKVSCLWTHVIVQNINLFWEDIKYSLSYAHSGKQAASAPASDSLVGGAQSRLSYPISRVELCQMPRQTCPSLQKSYLGMCVRWKVMCKQSGRGKHSRRGVGE